MVILFHNVILGHGKEYLFNKGKLARRSLAVQSWFGKKMGGARDANISSSDPYLAKTQEDMLPWQRVAVGCTTVGPRPLD